MPYSYTFQVYRFEKHRKGYLNLSQGTTFPFGIGFNATNQRRYFKPGANYLNLFIIDETLIKMGNDYVWLWVAIEPTDKTILGIRISIERNMLVAEQFIQSLIRKYGKHNISTDGGTWYPQACRFLNVEHHFHSSYQKSIIERTIQYIKDRTKCFDDYFPCRKDNNDCKLKHVMNWLGLFVDMHNREVMEKIVK